MAERGGEEEERRSRSPSTSAAVQSLFRESEPREALLKEGKTNAYRVPRSWSYRMVVVQGEKESARAL
jgi:hypothetical protein